jgi:SWI/SNF-related matrix-associated actin-dependent regulator of chromatin subfamily A protein 2/4
MAAGQQHNQSTMQQQQAYMQFLMQQKSMHLQQQAKMNMAGSSTRDQDVAANPAKMQELMALQAQAQAQMFKRQSENLPQAEKQTEQGQPGSSEQRSGDMRPPMPPQGVPGQQMSSAGMVRPMQPMQGQAGTGSIGGIPFQAIHAWAKEMNIDLSNPANANLISQILPVWQSRMAAMQKQQNEAMQKQQNETSMAAQQQQNQQMLPRQVSNDAPVNGNNPGQPPLKPRQPLPHSSLGSVGAETKMINPSNLQMQQQFSAHNREGSNERAVRPPMTMGNSGQMMQMTQSSGPVSKIPEQPNPKNALASSEATQMQYGRQLQQPNRATTPTATPADTGGSQAPTQGARPHSSFTKHQLHVLKAQILAFRRLKVQEH